MKPVTTTFDTKWEKKELLRLQELEEARNRTLQMEKTMRWWSDCTANWREKWCKVRKERNKARDEIKLLQLKIDSLMKQNSICQKEKHSLQMRNERMQRELEQMHTLLMEHIGSLNGFTATKSSVNIQDSGIEEYVLNGASVPKHAVEIFRDEYLNVYDTLTDSSSSSSEFNIAHLSRDKLLNHVGISETYKNTSLRRKEKLDIIKSLENVKSELTNIKYTCKNSNIFELNLNDHDDEPFITHSDLKLLKEDDRSLTDIQMQMNHIQAVNKWAENECLYAEILLIKQQIKKELSESKDALFDLKRQYNAKVSRLKQVEHANKNKLNNTIQQMLSNLKKSVTEKRLELDNASKRIEQYESDIKKLHSDIEIKPIISTEVNSIDNDDSRKLHQAKEDDSKEKIFNLEAQIRSLNIRLGNVNSETKTGASSVELTVKSATDNERDWYF